MTVGRRQSREILFPHRLLHINILSTWGRNANLLDCHFEIHNEEKLGIPERMLGADPTEAVVRFARTQKTNSRLSNPDQHVLLNKWGWSGKKSYYHIKWTLILILSLKFTLGA